MFDRILRQMRELVRTSKYVATTHAIEELEADGLTIFDVEHCILTGTIIARQRDGDTGEWKHLIAGKNLANEMVRTVAKIGPTGKLVIITVYTV